MIILPFSKYIHKQIGEGNNVLIVQKYGGSSVANSERIKHVAKRVIETYKQGNQVIIILSAQGNTTDDLLAKIAEINDNPSKREMDMILATGEQQSVALLSLAIQQLGYSAVSLNAEQAGITCTSNYSNARIEKIETKRIKTELERNTIVIVTGFQGINRYGDVVTLGRGGSDTSAVAIAAALNADICEIYTDVDGVYTSDPRIVPTARKLAKIGYDEMLEMASLGAGVLHSRSVELAKRHEVKLIVKSSFENVTGTIVEGENNVESTMINGVVLDEKIGVVSVTNIVDEPGAAFKIFSLLAKNKISIDIILQATGHNGRQDIVFTVAEKDLDETYAILKTEEKQLNCEGILINNTVAKLSIVGVGMESNPKIVPMMFEALYNQGINVEMISTSEIKLSVVIAKTDAKRGAKAVHELLIG